MWETLAIWLTGYSVFGGLITILTHFRAEQYADTPHARLLGILLIAGLGGLQIMHFGYLVADRPLFDTPSYPALLFAIAPLFYLFSTPILTAGEEPTPREAWHFLPMLLPLFAPSGLLRPLAFLLGAIYLLALARRLYALREQRQNYRAELLLVGAIFLIALLVSVLAMGWGGIDERLFITLYACAIGGALFLAQLLLARAPRLASEVPELARQVYARSTLGNVDTGDMLARLQRQMDEERLYRDPGLSLAGLASRLGLSAHQLSELINSQLGMNVSRYVRQQRVEAARRQLLAQPSRAVIEIGLEVGFASQSNFYSAFRELSGMTPAQYRRRHRGTAG